MIAWNNLDTLKAFQSLKNNAEPVDLTKEMAGENGAKRVQEYSVPMAAGLAWNYAAKAVNDSILKSLPSWPWKRSFPKSMRSCITEPSSTPGRSAWCCIS